MSQNVKEIRTACQDNVNQLGQTYRPVFDQIEKKLRKDVQAGEALENALLDFSGMLLEAQAAGLTVEEVFPDGADAFCEELIQALPVITERERAKRKKRIGVGVMAAIAAVILLVWGAKQMSLWSDHYVEGQDHPYMYRTFMGASTAYVKGEKDYFFIRGKYLYRFDPDTGEVSPLCTQEDCLHSRQPDALHYDMCNANVIGDSYGEDPLGYWDGYVYYIGSHDHKSYYTLNRVKEDGSEGETLKKWVRRDLDPWRWIIHRGYLYYAETEENLEDHTMEYTIKRLLLENPDEEEVIYQAVRDYTWLSFFDLRAYGNHLYFVQYENVEESRDIKIFTYDLMSKNLQEISLPSECDGYPSMEITFMQDKLVIYAHHDSVEVGSADKVYTAELDGSDLTPLNMEVYGCLFADEEYLYVLTNESTEDDKLELHVLDAKGKIVDSMSFAHEIFDLQFCVGDRDGILCIDPSNERKMWDIYWIDKREIGSWQGSHLELEPVDEMRYGYAYTRYLTEMQGTQE